MANILENTEDIMDDTNIILNVKSKAEEEEEEDDHIKLQEDKEMEQFSIENANQDDLSTSNENMTTSTSTTMSANEKQLLCSEYSDTDSKISLKSESTGIGHFPLSHEDSEYSSSLHRAAAAARVSFLELHSPDVSSIISKSEDVIGSNTNEENKKRPDGKLQEDTNSEHSTPEKEQNVSSVDEEKITVSENITSKSKATSPKQLQCSMDSCFDLVTEGLFKGESKDAEDTKNVSQKLEIKFEEKNESVESIKLSEDGKSSQSPLKLQNVSINCMEQKSSPKSITSESTSTKGKQLLCSAYSDSNSDSDSSVKDDNKDKFCSVYSDSEPEESFEKEKNVNDISKTIKDSQNTSTDLKSLPTVTDLNSKEIENKSNLESSLSALSNKKLEIANSTEEEEVQNQNFKVLKNLGDISYDPIKENNVNNVSSEMQELSKDVNKDFDMSVLFEPNDDSRSNSFTSQTEEKCDNNSITSQTEEKCDNIVTEQLYEEFSKIIEDGDKESNPLEYVTENKEVKTISPNLDEIIFRDFSINLTNLECMLGCKPVELLQDIDVTLSEWATLLVSQLSIRDEVISILHNSIEKLVQKGTTLEQDLDYQQIKITELKQQVKKKKRKHKHKSCQTDGEQFNSWKEYYEKYPHSYAQHFYQNNQWPVDCGVKDSSTNESTGELIKNTENSVKSQDDMNNKNQMDSETKETSEEEIMQNKNISKSNDVDNSSDNGNKSDEIIETPIEEDKDQQSEEPLSQIGTEPISQIATEDVTETESHGWDSSKSISDQVVAAASQIVEGTGYVYDQESGLYYDYNTGYYYNAETGLYYDSNSGTYFYYDHATQAYQFHSQITPESYESGPKIGNKRKIGSLEETHIPEYGLYYDSNSGTYFYYDQRTQAYDWMGYGYYYENQIDTYFGYDYRSQAYAEWNENSLYYDSNVYNTNQGYAEWNENSLCYESNDIHVNQANENCKENDLGYKSNVDHVSQANDELKKSDLDYNNNIGQTNKELKENDLDYNNNIDHKSQANEELKENDLEYKSNVDHVSQVNEKEENTVDYKRNLFVHVSQANEDSKENDLDYKSNVDERVQDNEELKENDSGYKSNVDEAIQANEESKENELDYKSNIDHVSQAQVYEELKESGLDYESKFGINFCYDYTSHVYNKLLDIGLSIDSDSSICISNDKADQSDMLQSQTTLKNGENATREIIKRKKIDSDILEEENMSGEEHLPLKKKKCKMKDETNEEKEDGECSESDEFSDGLDGVYGLNELSNEESDEEMKKEVADDVTEGIAISQSEVPPSLRLMVIQSEAKRVRVGSLHMVTVDGGTAGRESSNIVHLQDISVSKVHARFTFQSNGPSDFHYYVKDLGSNNGTFVNAIRLSEPRQESQEKELGHGWLLRLGQVTLKCHIHPGTLTCNECEPGLVAKTINKKKEGSGYKSGKSREKARKKEMKALKKKYALSYSDQSGVLSSEYKDRAENRRLVVGSDNPYEKTEVASTEIALTNRNKGFKMLEKMGWTEGHGIGKTTGLIEPIQPESSVGRSGFGSTVIPEPETTPDEVNRKKILGITQNRFNKL